MFSSLLEAARSTPFHGPLTPARCDAIAAPSQAMAADAAPAELGDSCEFGSNKYFLLCGLGGILSCGITHTAVVPLDLVKCRLQVDKDKYKNVVTGFRVSVAEEGMRGLAKGWAPTFIGYSLQGMCKFGLYEVFKVGYNKLLDEESAYSYRTFVYLAASASAEFFADIALSPLEAAKVRIQTMPGFASTLREAWPKMVTNEGYGTFYKGLVPLWGRQIPYTMMKFACFEKTVELLYKGYGTFYKGLVPLWGRQIPYTMMKFACFEKTVELLYKHVVPKPRADCSKGEQLVVTFAAGYIAGVFCAIVSHPADTVVSKLNQDKTATVGSIVGKLGFAGVWQGLGPRIVMIGTLTALQWFIYDAVKVYLRMPRPPPAEMPESMRKRLEAEGKLN